MTKRNKILTGIILSTALSTSLFANCMMGDKQGEMKMENCPMHSQKNMQEKNCSMGDKMHKKGFHNEHKEPILGLIRELNLSDEQKSKIKDIMKENRKNMKTTNEAFTKDSFDKNKYIEISTKKKDDMIKTKADTIEKIYGTLTAQQKEQLKVLMDSKKEKMEDFAEKTKK